MSTEVSECLRISGNVSTLSSKVYNLIWKVKCGQISVNDAIYQMNGVYDDLNKISVDINNLAENLKNVLGETDNHG